MRKVFCASIWVTEGTLPWISDNVPSDHLILHTAPGSSKWFKVSLKILLLYPYLCHDYLTQLYVLHTDL